MAKSKKVYQIPFDDNGSLMSYPLRKYVRDADGNSRIWVPNLRDNYEFEATMTYHGFDNGIRSAHRIIWRDDEGHTYPMFISRFGEALEAHGMQGKTMTGWWTFMKQGENFSLRAVTPKMKKKTAKQKKVEPNTNCFVHSSAFESMRNERNALRAQLDQWDRVCSTTLLPSIYHYISSIVKKENEKDG